MIEERGEEGVVQFRVSMKQGIGAVLWNGDVGEVRKDSVVGLVFGTRWMTICMN